MQKRTMLFEQFNRFEMFNSLLENVSSEIKDVQDDIKKVMDELGKEGVEDDEVKAAALLQALDHDGNLDDIDVEALKKEAKEGVKHRGETLNESASGVMHIIELIGSIAGNSALIEYLLEKVEEMTGKKMDHGKVKESIEKVVSVLRKVTGLPAKALEKFFGWLGDKLGMDIYAKKGMELLGMACVIVFLFGLGVAHFPVLGTGIMWWILSLTGLVGKSVEIARIGKEITHLIRKGNDKQMKDEIEGIVPDELAKMAGA